MDTAADPGHRPSALRSLHQRRAAHDRGPIACFGAIYPADFGSTMSGLDRATLEYLTDVVLNEQADRIDRLFSLRLLADEALAPAAAFVRRDTEAMDLLGKVAAECKDGFIRKFALLAVRRHQIAASAAETVRLR
jgi:hypothetical protein